MAGLLKSKKELDYTFIYVTTSIICVVAAAITAYQLNEFIKLENYKRKWEKKYLKPIEEARQKAAEAKALKDEARALQQTLDDESDDDDETDDDSEGS